MRLGCCWYRINAVMLDTSPMDQQRKQ
uniref:Uncharacterized protein n=1 Tax=Anguilla anguilla TaxID=7936 RepID=A0A0E9PY89_ANGAN